jgi:hypothetical protein
MRADGPLTSDNRIERLFCPHCGGEARDISGEHDYACVKQCGPRTGFIAPLRERDLQGLELIRLRLENEQLRMALRDAMLRVGISPNGPLGG